MNRTRRHAHLCAEPTMIRPFEIMTSASNEMRSVLFRSTVAAAVVAAAGLINSAVAQNSATVPSNADLKARCQQLISMYDRYGASRSENSDGARNHTRIGAEVDCREGRYDQGIVEMETLLKQKQFEVPPAPTGVAQTPSR
jgi:hypothetical protein